VEFQRQHAVADVQQTCAGISPDHALAIPCTLQDLQFGGRRREAGRPESIATGVENRLHWWGNIGRACRGAHGVDHLPDTDRVPHLEGAELPPKPPPHRPIDIVNGMRDVGRDPRGMEQCHPECGSKESPDLSRVEEECTCARRGIFTAANGFERGDLNGPSRPVREVSRVEHEDVGPLALVEPLSSLLADPAAIDQRLEQRGHRHLQIRGNVANDVQAGDIHRAECGALWPPECRPGDCVDFLDRVLARLQRLQHMHDREQADVIRDEIRTVLRDDDALPQAEVGKVRHSIDDRGIRLRGWNHLEEMQVPRWIEEMRPKPVTAEPVGAALCERRDGNARCVRRYDRAGAAHVVHAREQGALYLHLLDDGLDDHVDGRKPVHVCIESAGVDERNGIRRKKRIGLQRSGAAQSVPRDCRRQVEQQHRCARVGEVRGDLGAHDARAENRGGPDGRRVSH
jgi:hypothetical protein